MYDNEEGEAPFIICLTANNLDNEMSQNRIVDKFMAKPITLEDIKKEINNIIH